MFDRRTLFSSLAAIPFVPLKELTKEHLYVTKFKKIPDTCNFYDQHGEKFDGQGYVIEYNNGKYANYKIYDKKVHKTDIEVLKEAYEDVKNY